MPIRKRSSSPSITQHSPVSNVSDIYYAEPRKRKVSRSLKRLLQDSAPLNAFYEQLLVEGIDPADIQQGRTWGEPTEVFEEPGFWSRLLRGEQPNRYELDSLFVAPVVRYPAYREQYSPEKKITFHGITELPEEIQQQRILSAMLKLSQKGEGVKPEGGDQHYLETVWLIAQEIGISCTYQPAAERQSELLSTWTPSKEILEAKKARQPANKHESENLNQKPEETGLQLTQELPAAQPEMPSTEKQGNLQEPPLSPPASQEEKPNDEQAVKDEATPLSDKPAPQSFETQTPVASVPPDIAAQLAELQQSIAILNKRIAGLEEAIRELSVQIEENKKLAQDIAEADFAQAEAPIPETASLPASTGFVELTKRVGARSRSATRAKSKIAAHAAKKVRRPLKPKAQRVFPINKNVSAPTLAPTPQANIHIEQASPVVQEVVDSKIPLPTVIEKEFKPHVATFFENVEAAPHQAAASDAPITPVVEKPLPEATVATPVETVLPQNHVESFGSTEAVVQKADVQATSVASPLVSPAVAAEATEPVALALKEPTAIVLNRTASEAIATIPNKPNAIVTNPVLPKALAIKSDKSLALSARTETLAIVEHSARQTAIAPVENPTALVENPSVAKPIAMAAHEKLEPDVPAQTPPPVIEAVEERGVSLLPEEKPHDQEPTLTANATADVEEPVSPATTADETAEQIESKPKSLAEQKGENAKTRLYTLRDAGKKRAARMQNRNAEASDQTAPIEKAQEPAANNLIDKTDTANAAKQAPVEQQTAALEVPTEPAKVVVPEIVEPEIVKPLVSESPKPPKEDPIEAPVQLEPAVPQAPVEPAVAPTPQAIDSAEVSPVAPAQEGKAKEPAIEAPALVGTNPAVKKPSRLRNILGRYGLLKKMQVVPPPLTNDDLIDAMERAKSLNAMSAEFVDKVFGPATDNNGQCRKALSSYDVFALGTFNRNGTVVSSYMVTPNNWFTSPFRIELDSSDARLDDIKAHAAVTKTKYDAVFGKASPLNERAYYATRQDWDSLVDASKKPIDVEVDEAKRSVLNRNEQLPIEKESKKAIAKTPAFDFSRTKEQLDEILDACRAQKSMRPLLLTALLGHDKDPDLIGANLKKLKVFHLGTTEKDGEKISVYGFSREDWPTKRMYKGEMSADDPRKARVDMSVKQTADEYEKKYGFRPSVPEQKEEPVPVARDFEGGGKPDHPSDTSLPAVEALGAFYKRVGSSTPVKRRAVDKMFGDPDDDKCAEVLANRNVFFVAARRNGQTMISSFAVVEGNDLANVLRIDVDEHEEAKRHDTFYAASDRTRKTYIEQDALDIHQFILEERGAQGDRKALIERAERSLGRHHAPAFG